jgi:hypothetical protein
MNKIETIAYDLVKRHPKIKFLLRDSYQSLFDMVPVKSIESSYPVTAREGYFFGFHDHTPFSYDNQFLLANRHKIPLKMPGPNDALGVGFFDGENYMDFHPIGETFAWNWHQGCKLQWKGNSHTLVYNDHQSGRNIAYMVDINCNQKTEIPYSIGSISSDGNHAVGYSFERVNRYMPGYGYIQKAGDEELEDKRPSKAGIYLIDFENQSTQNILSIKSVSEIKSESSMKSAYHYFSHTIFSPSGKRFAFLHRWVKSDVRKRWSRLITCDLSGGDINIFPTHEMVSHLGWRDGDHILAYCRLRGKGDHYVLFRDQTEDYYIVGENSFSSDGHPSFSPDGRWIITDTYPDRTRRCFLILFDAIEKRRYNIARMKSPKEFATVDAYKHWQCDLHPRWDREGLYICFDSSFSGERSLCLLSFGERISDIAEPRSI